MTPISSLADTTGTSSERATRSAVRCRVPVSLVGTRGIGNEVNVGPGDAATVGGHDDRTVHLRQLGQPLRAVRGIDEESARADRQHVGVVAEHEQRAGLGAHDAVDAVAQRRAWCDPSERIAHRFVHAAVPGVHALILDGDGVAPSARSPAQPAGAQTARGRFERRARRRRSPRTALRPGPPRCRRRSRASSPAPPRGEDRVELPR